MKQFINIYIISFVLILSQLSLFSSCKDEDTVAELKLDRTAIQIKEGSEGILKIEIKPIIGVCSPTSIVLLLPT